MSVNEILIKKPFCYPQSSESKLKQVIKIKESFFKIYFPTADDNLKEIKQFLLINSRKPAENTQLTSNRTIKYL